MRIGSFIGMVCAAFAIVMGAYYAVLPVLASLSAESISSQQAGTYFSTIGVIIGLSFLSAFSIAFIYNRQAIKIDDR